MKELLKYIGVSQKQMDQVGWKALSLEVELSEIERKKVAPTLRILKDQLEKLEWTDTLTWEYLTGLAYTVYVLLNGEGEEIKARNKSLAVGIITVVWNIFSTEIWPIVGWKISTGEHLRIVKAILECGLKGRIGE